MRQSFFSSLVIALHLIFLSSAALSSPIKWNPGHYMMINSKDYPLDNTFERGVSLAALEAPNASGIALSVKWTEIEPRKDVYTWNYIDRWLEVAVKYKKQLMVRIVDRDFGTTLQNSVDQGWYPDYLLSDPEARTSYNLTGRCLVQKYRDSLGGNTGAQFAMYLPECMDRLIKVTLMMAERYNNHPNFEALFHEETALTLGQSTDVLAETDVLNTAENQRTQYFRWMKQLKDKLPNTMFIFNMNFWRDNDPSFKDDPVKALDLFINADNKVQQFSDYRDFDLLSFPAGGIMHPDSVYTCPNYSGPSSTLMRQYRGAGLSAPEIAIAPQVQRADGKCGNVDGQEEQLYQLVRNDYGATHVLWIQRDDIRKISNAHPEIKTIPCPTSFSSCVSRDEFADAIKVVPPSAPIEFIVQ